MVMSTSAEAAASLGEAARRAPAGTSESARAAVRFQTTRRKPALRRLWPIGRPIRPSPIKLTVGCGTIASKRLGKRQLVKCDSQNEKRTSRRDSLAQQGGQAHIGGERGIELDGNIQRISFGNAARQPVLSRI